MARPDPHLDFVFVSGDAAPDLETLAARIAAGLDPGPRPSPRPGGFGARQRWSLTRLRFLLDPAAVAAELYLVRRPTFLAPEDVEAWIEAPPADAIRLPPGTDGLVDAEAPPDAILFYALLAGPAPFRPVPIAPDPPPYSGVRAPHVLGDLERALAPGVRGLLEVSDPVPEDLVPAGLPPRLALLEAAVALLPPASSLRREVDGAVREWREREVVRSGS